MVQQLLFPLELIRTKQHRAVDYKLLIISELLKMFYQTYQKQGNYPTLTFSIAYIVEFDSLIKWMATAPSNKAHCLLIMLPPRSWQPTRQKTKEKYGIPLKVPNRHSTGLLHRISKQLLQYGCWPIVLFTMTKWAMVLRSYSSWHSFVMSTMESVTHTRHLAN